MVSMNNQEEELIELLLGIRRENVSAADATRLLRERLIAVGSATPDNVNCASLLEVGHVRNEVVGQESLCIKVKGREISVSDVVHRLEGLPMPPGIRRGFPELTGSEWNAGVRVTTLVMLMFERAQPHEPKRSKPRRT